MPAAPSAPPVVVIVEDDHDSRVLLRLTLEHAVRRALMVLVLAGCGPRAAPPLPRCDVGAAPFSLTLASGWQLRSSDDVHGDGSAVSTLGFDTGGWYRTDVPSTVSGTLAQ